MARFLDIPIETDPDTLKQTVYDILQEHFPEWEPSDGNLETWLIDAFTRTVSDLRELAADVPVEIFKQYGLTVIGIPINNATPATATTKWVMADNAGYKIPAGTELGMRVNGELIGFRTQSEIIIPAGFTEEKDVIIEAIEPGDEANSLEGELFLISAVTGDPVVTLQAPTSGGVDEETDTEYLARLVEELRTLSPTPITPEDFVILAKRRPQVGRALALDLYDPVSETDENERYMTTVVIDPDGEELTAEEMKEIEEEFEGMREVNFVSPVIGPDYSKMDAELKVKAYAGFDLEALKTQIKEAIETLFDPANFGQPPFGEGDEWVYDDKVRFNKVEAAAAVLQGVNYVVSTKIAIQGNPLEEKDVTLPGRAPLTRPGNITIVVEAP